MKNTLLTTLLFLCLSPLYAQEKGKFRVGADLSIDNTLFQMIEDHSFFYSTGKSYALGLHYNLTDKMNIGLKYINQTFGLFFSTAFKEFSAYSPMLQPIPSEIDGKSLLVDYNYYLHKKGKPVSHFFEFGVGVLYFPIKDFHSGYASTSGSYGQSSTFPKYTFSEIVAYGIEFNHVRLSLEYLFSLPTTSIDLNSNSYRFDEGYKTYSLGSRNIFLNRITLKLGFYIGGGSWKR